MKTSKTKQDEKKQDKNGIVKEIYIIGKKKRGSLGITKFHWDNWSMTGFVDTLIKPYHNDKMLQLVNITHQDRQILCQDCPAGVDEKGKPKWDGPEWGDVQSKKMHIFLKDVETIEILEYNDEEDKFK